MDDFKIKDINLADWGRKEIKIAETEMPGLMQLRTEFKDEKPLDGARMSTTAWALTLVFKTSGVKSKQIINFNIEKRQP